MGHSSQVHIAAFLMLLATIVLLVAGTRAWKRGGLDGRLFGAVLFAACFWLTGSALGLLLPTLTLKLYSGRIEYIGIAVLPPVWLLFAVSLSSKRRWLSRRTIAAVMVVPAITIALIWTTSYQGLHWSAVSFDADASPTGLVVERGPWFWIHTVYSYSALLGSNIALVVMFARAMRLYRRHALLMIIGLQVPWLTNIGYLLLGGPTTVDPTPLAVAFSGLLLAWGLWRWHLLDIRPLPRARSIEGMSDGVIALDHYQRIVDYNTAAATLLDFDGRTVLGSQLDEAVPALAALQITDELTANMRIEVPDAVSAGSNRVLETRLSAVNENGSRTSGHWLVIVRDITEQDRAERLLRAAEARYRTLIEQMPAVTYIRKWSDELEPIYVSPQVQDLLGYDAEAICSDEPPIWAELIHVEDQEHVLMTHRRAAQLYGNFAAEYRLRRASGEIVWVRDEAVIIGDDNGGPLRWQGVIADVTQQKQLESQLEHYAFYDTLTGLPNRALLLDRLRHSLSRVAREDKLVGVLFIDLDGFKIINDTLGHEAGDRVLEAVAQRLEANLRPGDTAGRLGGDEFVVVIESVESPDTVLFVAERIIDEIRQPMVVTGQEVVVTASVGVRTSTPGDSSPDEFLRDADIAMYWAKSRGRSRAAIFDTSMLVHQWNRLGLETELRAALRDGQMEVYYQPIVSIGAGRITGFEALLRWMHPERGELPPSDFLQTAEEAGLMMQIDRWVLNTACRQVAGWRERLKGREGWSDLSISVNITPKHVEQPTLIDDISHALRQSGLSAEYLTLEITENHTMRDVSMAGKRLEQIAQLGAKVIIDDFGTGYSALAYLREFPVSGIKIDRSFVSGLGIRADETSLVNAVVSLAHSFNLEVTAEGIETRGQWSDLDSLGAELGQGYLIARPLSAADIDAYIESGDLAAVVRFPETPRLRIVSGE